MYRYGVQGLEALSVKDKANTDSNTPKSAGTTNPVKVSLRVWLIIASSLGGNVVIDDHRNGLNVDTSRKDVGCDENFGTASTEIFKDGISLTTFESSVDSDDFVAILCQTCRDS